MKKGFTLIELLAVIIVLGIIALIAIPAVTNVIEDASKGAAEVSAKHYMDALNDKISLLELDEDGENDIANGIKNVGDIDVNIKGDMPTSGTYKIQNGKVVEANLVVNGYNVKCTNKCVATKGVTTYVYYASIGNGLTSLDDSNKLTEPPSDKRVYLKYPVKNNTLGAPQVCAVFDYEECLNVNEYTTSRDKMLNFVAFDTSTWEQDPDEPLYWNSGVFSCLIEDDDIVDGIILPNQGTRQVECTNPSGTITVDSTGLVYIGANGFKCNIQGNGTTRCW